MSRGLQKVQYASVAAAARTSVASAAADTALLAASPGRSAVAIFNDSTAILYVGYGSTAVSTTDFSAKVAVGGYLDVPAQFAAGAIRGYWASANGYARVTAG